jgi:hypothetical integral membrane protein (TIGR02206 family)
LTGPAYWLAAAVAAGACAALCVGARRHPASWSAHAARVLSVLLVADAATFVLDPFVTGHWHVRTSLPLALCDVALVVAAAACWWRHPLLVELTYFWGLAGTLQAVVTPDLSTTFPHLEFFEYVVGHLGIVVAAVYLVVGLRLHPRRRAVWRVLAITVTYTAAVGLFDAVTGSDYMFLRYRPRHWSLLNVLGPWPVYLFSAAGVAVVLLMLLDAPFVGARRARHLP